MARQGWYIITAEQKAILELFGYGGSIETIGTYYCVSDWSTIYAAVVDAMNATLEDENPDNDATDTQYNTMDATVNFMYYSTESHSWISA